MMPTLPNPLILPVGVALGVLVAAPIGPVNVLVIQRAASRGLVAGIAAGLGAVLGDGLIAFLTSLGVGQITTAIRTYRDTIEAVGGAVLAGFGFVLFNTRTLPRADADDNGIGGANWRMLADIPKTFLLTVTNPGGVLGLAAIFGGVSSYVEIGGRADAIALTLALMLGSLTWWCVLSAGVTRFVKRLDEARLIKINRLAGALLVIFGGLLLTEVGWHALK